jgi:hypothetical protein
LLPERSTLVAPGLPDPYVRGSAKPIERLTMTAKGTDPIRYATHVAKNKLNNCMKEV